MCTPETAVGAVLSESVRLFDHPGFRAVGVDIFFLSNLLEVPHVVNHEMIAVPEGIRHKSSCGCSAVDVPQAVSSPCELPAVRPNIADRKRLTKQKKRNSKRTPMACLPVSADDREGNSRGVREIPSASIGQQYEGSDREHILRHSRMGYICGNDCLHAGSAQAPFC